MKDTSTPAGRVRAALCNTREDYLRRCLAQRVPGDAGSSGSTFRVTDVEALLALLHTAEWEPYTHPAVLPGCTAFRAPLPGELGIVDLHALPGTAPVVLADPKGTGHWSAHVGREQLTEDLVAADFSVIILGPDESVPDGPEMVWTFHPGDPIRPSSVAAKPGVESVTLTAHEAIARGFDLAKVTS